jgi:hypothetical protein
MMKKLTQLILLSIASLSTVHAAEDNFNCPQPSQIQSTNFTSPSIWTAPPVAHSAPGTVGVGLGGTHVKELLGAQPAKVNNRNGWVCVYKSEGGLSVNEYQAKIRKVIGTTSYLQRYVDKMNKFFDGAEPYLKKYPKDQALGFVGYQKAN